MSEYNQDTLTQDVVAAFAGTPDKRLRELMTALVKHVHAFAREVDLTPDEWLAGLKFLNATGQISTDKRPEFILLSDTLGLSMMIVALQQARASGNVGGAMPPTEATVEGPFYWAGAPDLPLGADIGEGVPGEPALYMGRVTDLNGNPLAGALLDVWSGDGDGKYDVQLSQEPVMKARGRFRTDAEGRYWFWSIRPTHYPVPDDGPGRRDDARHRAQHLPPGAHPHGRLGGRPCAADHAHLRRRQPVHRRGRGLRQARQPGGRVRQARTRQGGRRPRDEGALLLGQLRLPPRACAGLMR